jgi:Yip1 domain
MLMNRIMGALTFRKGVYAEVESDASFTSSAWLIVVVAAALNKLGSAANAGNVGNWIISAIIGAILAVAGFAVSAFVIDWVGRTLFKAQSSFQEVVRTVGLAYVWNAVAFVGIVGLISGALSCVVAPITILAALAGLVAWFMAVKEALDLDWVPTIITVVIGWVVGLLIGLLASPILALFGIAGAGLAGLFG